MGIFGGGSLSMWKKYFHPKSRIIGIDLNPKSKKYEKFGYEIYIGDQEDEKFWNKFYREVGKIDILLDDGGHTDLRQAQTLISSISKIKENGLIVIEDIHTSYFTEFGNPSKNSFINYSKKIIDLINFRYSGLNKNIKNKNKIYKLLERNIFSISFFESIVAFRINSKKNILSKAIWNRKKVENILDYRYKKNSNNLWEFAISVKRILPYNLSNFSLLKIFLLHL